jgi:hypothetical protein
MRSIVLSILPISLFVVPLSLACDKVGADSHEGPTRLMRLSRISKG